MTTSRHVNPAVFCAQNGCGRRWVRTVDGDRFCMYHPTDEPPVFDAKGKAVSAATGVATVIGTPTQSAVSVRSYRQPTDLPAHLRPDPAPVKVAEHTNDITTDRDELVDMGGGHSMTVGALQDLEQDLAAEEAADPALAELGHRAEEAGQRLLAAVQDQTRSVREVVHVPPPAVEDALTALEMALERLLDEVATVRGSVRDIRIAYATPAPEPELIPTPAKRPRQISPEGRERMRESGRRLQQLRRERAAAAAGDGQS